MWVCFSVQIKNPFENFFFSHMSSWSQTFPKLFRLGVIMTVKAVLDWRWSQRLVVCTDWSFVAALSQFHCILCIFFTAFIGEVTVVKVALLVKNKCLLTKLPFPNVCIKAAKNRWWGPQNSSKTADCITSLNTAGTASPLWDLVHLPVHLNSPA